MLATFAWLGLVAVAAAAQPEPAAPSPEDYVRFDLFRSRDRVEADGALLRTVEARVLLRNATAVSAFGQLGIFYIDGFADVRFEDLKVEKPDGRLVEVKGRVEDVNPFGVTQASIAADLRYRKVTLPGLEPGDTLSYRIEQAVRPLAAGWVFGEAKLAPLVGEPVQEYLLDLPRDARINVRLRSGLGAEWQEVAAPVDRLVRRLSWKVLRPKPGKDGFTKAEAAELTEPDVLYSSFRSWREVARWWWELARSRLVPDAAVEAEARRLIEGKPTPRERLLALHAFVATRIRYLSVSFGIGRMQPRPAADVLANRYGDCKDKHALLAALAAAVDIDVRPVLVHSGRADPRDDVPGPQQFDHMISVARLGKEPADWLWLDTTGPFAAPAHLNLALRDKRGLLIEASGDASLVRTPAEPPFVPTQDVEMKGTLDAGGALRGHVVWKLRSDDEPTLRAIFAATPQDRRAEVVQASLARSWHDGKVTNVTTSDPTDVATPFRIEFDAERPAPGNPAKSLWLPLADFELPAPPAEPAPGEPGVEFPVREFSVRSEVSLPEGVSARAPLSVSLERPFGRFESVYAVEGAVLRVRRSLALSRRTLTSDELPSYEAFRKAIDTDREQEFLLSGSSALEHTAAALHERGLSAFTREDYGQAVELLRQATEADPKQKDAWNDLGRALRGLGRRDEAVRAFTRQIEVDRYHESAYAERAYTLIAMDRWDEAERDLLEQIEVAPFKAWSYDRLADRRFDQRRYREAADYYARAAAIESKQAERWADLGRALQLDGRGAEAREAMERARGLDPADWLAIDLAQDYAALGDLRVSGELAAGAMGKVEARLAKLSPDSFDEGDLYWSRRLLEAWELAGAAAAEANEVPKARRYLEAAWALGRLPTAALRLSELHLREVRPAEAVRLLCLATSIGGGLPPQERARATQEGVDCTSASAELLELRTIRLSAAGADLHDEVLLLVEADGRVVGVKKLTRNSPEQLDRVLAASGPLRLAFTAPDERPFKAVRRGVVACSRASGCSLILDVPGAGPLRR